VQYGMLCFGAVQRSFGHKERFERGVMCEMVVRRGSCGEVDVGSLHVYYHDVFYGIGYTALAIYLHLHLHNF